MSQSNDSFVQPGDEDRRIAAPFEDWSSEHMKKEIEAFIEVSGLHDERDYIERGARLARDKKAFLRKHNPLPLRHDKRERYYLDIETNPNRKCRFNQTWTLYAVVILCSLGAAVQGWDESAVSGALISYQFSLDIWRKSDAYYLGLVNAAPYLCCTFACWLNYPLNKWFGRRGTILITCIISSATCLGQGFVKTWQQLFAARFLLGFGIGPKSATIPVFAAECAPANVRGALVMMWQTWTAFGIMCGYIAGVLLYNVAGGSSSSCNSDQLRQAKIYGIDDVHHVDNAKFNDQALQIRTPHCTLNWRLMLASPMILPLFVIAYVYCLPESPRWLLRRAHQATGERKKRYCEQAWSSLCSLRHTKLQAARDLFLIYHLLKNEEALLQQKQSRAFLELFTVPRNRRALTASAIVMFFQQFCGVNVLVYYMTYVLHYRQGASFSTNQALLAGMGFGIINFVCSFPAVWTIDTLGRRTLLLLTFPLMALFQGFIAIALGIQDEGSQPAVLLVGIYLFAASYSPGEGPVPFVYSAESMPLYNRDFGMGIATSVLWFFNFVLAITTPGFLDKFRPWGTFLWYSAWCVVGWGAILLFVPETKDLHLEQLKEVFEKHTAEHVSHGFAEARYFFKHYFLRDKRVRRPQLVGSEDFESEDPAFHTREPIGAPLNDIELEENPQNSRDEENREEFQRDKM